MDNLFRLLWMICRW